MGHAMLCQGRGCALSWGSPGGGSVWVLQLPPWKDSPVQADGLPRAACLHIKHLRSGDRASASHAAPAAWGVRIYGYELIPSPWPNFLLDLWQKLYFMEVIFVISHCVVTSHTISGTVPVHLERMRTFVLENTAQMHALCETSPMCLKTEIILNIDAKN